MRGLQLNESESPNNNVERSLVHRRHKLDLPSVVRNARGVEGMVNRNDDR
jgi:hypothetical protein